MKERYRVGFLSVVPSPYQRDLFAALARRPEVDLRVDYLEAAAPDSPWERTALPNYSRILPGFWFSIGSARCHVNVPGPDFRDRDLVVLNTLMSATAQWMIRARLRRKPWIFWGERIEERRQGVGGVIHNRLTAPLNRAAGIVGIGSLAERQYADRFPGPKHWCIPYHCDLAPFMEAPRTKCNRDETVFLFCGQMIARKGLDLLLAAFIEVAGRHPGARLLLVGREAELPVLLEPVPAPIRQRIDYAGFKAPEALPEQFARADVFILPSRYDGWGVVVNQALGAGLPIICSDRVGAGYDLVEEGVNGLRFPAGDVAALARCMEQFAAGPGLAQRFGAVSREKAKAWTPDIGAEKWVRVFREVLGK